MWAWTTLVSLKILIVQNKTEYHLVGNSLVLKQQKSEVKNKNNYTDRWPFPLRTPALINGKYEVKCRMLHA